MIIYKDLFGGNDELASDTYKIKVNIISIFEKTHFEFRSLMKSSSKSKAR